jgi:hypothetical protein
MQVVAPVAYAVTPLYASWGSRFAAWLLDLTIVGSPLVFAGAFLGAAIAPAWTSRCKSSSSGGDPNAKRVGWHPVGKRA